MLPPLLLALAATKLWYLMPLVVSISLVYAATRHELVDEIIKHAIRFGIWIVGFMGVVFGLIYFLSRGL